MINIFALSSLLASFTAIILGFYVLIFGSNGLLNRVFFVFCLFVTYWAFVEYGLRQSSTREAAFFWAMSNFLWPVALALLLHFVLVFTERAQWLENRWLYIAIYLPAITITFLQMYTGVFTPDVLRTYWGWTYQLPHLSPVVLLCRYAWPVLIVFASICLCFRYYLGAGGYTKRGQAGSVMLGVLAVSVLGLTTEVIFPFFNLRVPELTVTGFVACTMFMGYAIMKYELFVLTPEAAAANSLPAMPGVKQNVFDAVSHKLMTPITVISTQSELFNQGTYGPLNAAQKNAVDVIYKQVQSLKGLIAKMLNYITVVSKNITLSRAEINLADWLPGVVNALAGSAGKKVEATVDCPGRNLKLLINKKYFDLMIGNLVENAIKFGDKEPVKITVSARRGQNGLQIRVTDNGPGIPPEEQDKVFQEFYQLEKNFTGQVEGAGLGLAMVKNIVELSGGKIGVESTLGQGTTFIIDLPGN